MEMTPTKKKFSVAALAVFQRFGVRKATMEEIAAEAGVSKPTLYATFRNKDAALAGAIFLAKGAALDTLRDAWSDADTLPHKLDLLFEIMVLAGFDMLHNAPDADAFENALGDASRQAIEQTRQDDVMALKALFEGSPALETLGISAERYAKFVMTSAMNAKRLSRSRAELEEYLNSLKTTVLATVDS